MQQYFRHLGAATWFIGARIGERPLTQPTAGVRLVRWGQVFLPHSRPSVFRAEAAFHSSNETSVSRLSSGNGPCAMGLLSICNTRE